MEYVKIQDAQKFTKSMCTIYEYAMENSEMNIAVAEIEKRYPLEGYAVNYESSEMGYVLKGSGRLVTEGSEAILSTGDVVYIPRGEKYFWEGNLSLVLPCTPAWHPDQHKTNIPLSNVESSNPY